MYNFSKFFNRSQMKRGGGVGGGGASPSSVLQKCAEYVHFGHVHSSSSSQESW